MIQKIIINETKQVKVYTLTFIKKPEDSLGGAFTKTVWKIFFRLKRIFRDKDILVDNYKTLGNSNIRFDIIFPTEEQDNVNKTIAAFQKKIKQRS